MRVLCLVDEPVIPPDRWMWNHLTSQTIVDEVEFLNISPLDKYPGWGKLLSYYPAYFALAAQALWKSRSKQYDVIIAWEAKTGFPLAVLRGLLGIRQPKLLILAFAYKGIALHFARLGRWFMKYVDHITVPTTAEVSYYQRLLRLRREQVSLVLLGGWEAGEPKSIQLQEETFIFAGGRTERDYATLFKAIDGLPIKVIVNARPFNLHGLDRPPNVSVNDMMPLSEYYALMRKASFIVIPLQNTPHAAGLTHILQAMSAGKAIIATRTTGTLDYIVDGKTGLLVEAGNALAMRMAIQHLLANPELVRQLAHNARQRYLTDFTSEAFAQRNYAVLSALVTS